MARPRQHRPVPASTRDGRGADGPPLRLLSGAGNCFALADARTGKEPADPSRLARELCRGGVLRGGPADGLLVLTPPRSGGDARLHVWNADGSRAAACGNGLRCAAWSMLREEVERGRTPRPLCIETDAGVRAAELVSTGAGTLRVRVGMGRGETFALSSPPPDAGRGLEAIGVRLGNPHCVLRVEDERAAPVEELGRALQRHPDFPEGVNAGFLARRAGGWHLRVFERGVGETAACGSGACAAALAAVGETLGEAPFEVHMPGGLLVVERGAGGELFLTGEVEDLGALARAAIDGEGDPPSAPGDAAAGE